MLIDTGGIQLADDDVFGASIRSQALLAAEEADCIILLVDGRSAPTDDDARVAQLLQGHGKPVLLAANKLDDPADEGALHEFWALGLGEPRPVSAVHGHGTGDLLDDVAAALPEVEVAELAGAVDVAIVGRPNAGKSSLMNRLVGFERAIVSEAAGTTRDALDTVVEHEGGTYRFVDTAGLRRRSQIDESVEYYGFVRAMRVLDRADVALVVVDCGVGVTTQDQRIASYACEKGCAIGVILNKWDLVETEEDRERIEYDLGEKLGFVSFAPVVRTSALTARGVGRIYALIDHVHENHVRTHDTKALNRFLGDLRAEGHTVSSHGRTLRLKYVTQTHVGPPGFTFFANHPSLVDDPYRRYLENRLREAFELAGTPVILRFRKAE
jgi:GTP-binding protein